MTRIDERLLGRPYRYGMQAVAGTGPIAVDSALCTAPAAKEAITPASAVPW